MEKKEVYILSTEKNWRCEEYYDIIDVFSNRKDAIKALKEQRDSFIEDVKEYDDVDVLTNDDYEIVDTDTHFQCLDECMGYNFELFVTSHSVK